MSPRCHACSHPFSADIRSRSEECSNCRRDLRVCLNCTFYDRAAYNECREPQAERVVAKDRANFCDFFRPKNGALAAVNGETSIDKSKGDLMKSLDDLFKK